jgi:hypothetical protein
MRSGPITRDYKKGFHVVVIRPESRRQMKRDANRRFRRIFNSQVRQGLVEAVSELDLPRTAMLTYWDVA